MVMHLMYRFKTHMWNRVSHIIRADLSRNGVSVLFEQQHGCARVNSKRMSGLLHALFTGGCIVIDLSVVAIVIVRLTAHYQYFVMLSD